MRDRTAKPTSMMLNEYMTCMRGPEPMTIFSQSHLVEKPSTCSIPYTILLPYWKDHLSLAFERWLWMCAHRRLHITNLASYSRYNRSKPGQVFVDLAHPWIVAMTHSGCWLHSTILKLVKGSWRAATDLCTLCTRVKIRLHHSYIEDRRWLARDGAVTDLS